MSPSSPGMGVLPVDKPPGPTSHDVVAQARRALRIRKIGHTGTLDPFASGLLLLCIGPATRIADHLKALPKEYEAVARLGRVTATDDLEGEVLEEDQGWDRLDDWDVEEALASFRGRIRQLPPRYSAKKVGGEAAHRRARRGEVVELSAAEVEVEEIELLDLSLPDVTFRVRCSTGTYIRALARDLGEALGVGAHLTELRRTRVGPFGVEDALAASRLDRPEEVEAAWVPGARALGHLPGVEVGSEEVRRLRQGQRITRPAGLGNVEGPVVLARGDTLVALGSVEGDAIQPRKVFPS